MIFLVIRRGLWFTPADDNKKITNTQSDTTKKILFSKICANYVPKNFYRNGNGFELKDKVCLVSTS